MVYFRLYMSVHIKSFENEVVLYGKSQDILSNVK